LQLLQAAARCARCQLPATSGQPSSACPPASAEKEGRDLADDVHDAFDDDLDTAKGMARLFAEVRGPLLHSAIGSAVQEPKALPEAWLVAAAAGGPAGGRGLAARIAL
jgi:hypothetical protein